MASRYSPGLHLLYQSLGGEPAVEMCATILVIVCRTFEHTSRAMIIITAQLILDVLEMLDSVSAHFSWLHFTNEGGNRRCNWGTWILCDAPTWWYRASGARAGGYVPSIRAHNKTFWLGERVLHSRMWLRFLTLDKARQCLLWIF